MSDDIIEPAASRDDTERFYDKFYVQNAGEIRHYLHRLVNERCTLTVRADGSSDNTATMALLLEGGYFWIDVPPSETMLKTWLTAKQLRVEGSINGAPLRFAAGPAVLGTVDDLPALRLPLPARVMYLQRREFVRREPPMDALFCRIRIGEGDKAKEIRMPIPNIGGGGLAFITTRDVLNPQVEELLQPCWVELGDDDAVEVKLLVRHSRPRVSIAQNAILVGCKFVDLQPIGLRKLYRYLLQLDRERMRKTWDD